MSQVVENIEIIFQTNADKDGEHVTPSSTYVVFMIFILMWCQQEILSHTVEIYM